MIATYVPPTKTPLTPQAAAKVLGEALAAALGQQPSTATLALAMAHTALETGRWQSIYNHNWGNVKASDSYAGLYTCLGSITNPVSEILNNGDKSNVEVFFVPGGRLDKKGGTIVAERCTVPPGHPQTRFRAYPTAQAGASNYVTILQLPRYTAAWEALKQGNCDAFVRSLKDGGYFTAGLDNYLKSVGNLQSEYLAALTDGEAAPFRTGAPVKIGGNWHIPVFFS